MYCFMDVGRAEHAVEYQINNENGALAQMRYAISGASQTASRVAFGTVPIHTPLLRLLACVLGIVVFLLAIQPDASARNGVALSFLADETASMTIEQAASDSNATKYKGYVPSFSAFSALPDSFNGAIWLRFVLDTSFEKPLTALRVDLGTFLPGVTRLYIPQADGTYTVMNSRPPQAIFTLPDNGPLPDVLYARLDGTPGLWFRPDLGPAKDSLRLLPLHFFLGGLFAFAMLLQIIQYVRKAEEWRLWSAIAAGCGIVGAILPSTPAAGAAFTPLMATGMVMPGLTILLLAHTARHLFDSPRTMPGYDKAAFLVYLLGAAVALAPLVPGFLWISRYLPFAGILILLLMPMAMAAMALALKGYFIFFCACVVTLAGVAASAWALTATDASVLSYGGLWGLALSMILLAFIPPATEAEEDKREDDVFDCLNRAASRTNLRMAEDSSPSENEESALAWTAFRAEPAPPPTARPWADALTLAPEEISEPPLTDGSVMPAETPHLQAVTKTDHEEEEVPGLSWAGEARAASQLPAQEKAAPIATPQGSAPLPIPDSALKERPFILPSSAPSPVDEPPMPPAQEHADAEPEIPCAVQTPVGTSLEVPATETRDSDAGAQPVYLDDEHTVLVANVSDAPESPQPFFAPPATPEQARKILFDLPLLIKNVYDALAPMAEEKNLGLTWFIAPQTGRLFEGEADLLESALRLLLHDMVDTLAQGNVRLNVRRLPNSPEAGHLVFVIVEWNAKETSRGRNMAGLSEAWALAERTGGIFSVEHSPTSGTTVIFSSVFAPMDTPKADAPESPSPVPTETAPPETAAGGIDPAPATVSTAKSPHAPADYPGIVTPKGVGNGLSASAAPAHYGLIGVDGDELLEERETIRANDRLIVADIAKSSRARTASVFAGTPYAVIECASPADARSLYLRHPSALLVINADMPEVDIIEAMKEIHADDKAHGRAPVPLVALVGYGAQADRLLNAGCARTVMKDMIKEELLAVVQELVPLETAGGKTGFAPITAVPFAGAAPTAETAAPEPEERAQAAIAGTPPPVEPRKEESVIQASSSGMGILDMIVTDEDESSELSTTQTPPAPENPTVRDDAEAPGPMKRARITVKPVATPKLTLQAPENRVKHPDPTPPLTAGEVSSDTPERGNSDIPAPSISIPVPGEEDSVFKEMLPLVPGLIVEMTDAMQDAARGREEKSPLLVREAAERIAQKAERFGLTRLERMARCVERAASADDIEPMECVLQDLEAWVGRYKGALQRLHREVQW